MIALLIAFVVLCLAGFLAAAYTIYNYDTEAEATYNLYQRALKEYADQNEALKAMINNGVIDELIDIGLKVK
jgi:hypothetical protein